MNIELVIHNVSTGDRNTDKTVKVGVVLKGDIGDEIYVIEPGECEHVLMPEYAGLLVEAISEDDRSAMQDDATLPNDEYLIPIAEQCHEANRKYCESIGDTSQLDWADAPAWQRESALHGVKRVLCNPSITAEGVHLQWLMIKASEGWAYGKVKDQGAKTHPSMVPFAALPVEHQRKDEIFIATAKEGLGYHEHATGAVAG